MKEHARKRHEEETRDFSKEFFYENNSFYLARNPEHYAQVVVPTPRISELAEQAQSAVEQWVHVNKNNIRSLSEWREGWGYDIRMTEKEYGISIYSDITDIDELFETVASPKPEKSGRV